MHKVGHLKSFKTFQLVNRVKLVNVTHLTFFSGNILKSNEKTAEGDLQDICKDEIFRQGINYPCSLRINSVLPGFAARYAVLQDGDTLIK